MAGVSMAVDSSSHCARVASIANVAHAVRYPARNHPALAKRCPDAVSRWEGVGAMHAFVQAAEKRSFKLAGQVVGSIYLGLCVVHNLARGSWRVAGRAQ